MSAARSQPARPSGAGARTSSWRWTAVDAHGLPLLAHLVVDEILPEVVVEAALMEPEAHGEESGAGAGSSDPSAEDAGDEADACAGSTVIQAGRWLRT